MGRDGFGNPVVLGSTEIIRVRPFQNSENDAVAVKHQKFEQRILLRGEADRMAGASDCVAGGIDHQVGHGENLRMRRSGSSGCGMSSATAPRSSERRRSPSARASASR